MATRCAGSPLNSLSLMQSTSLTQATLGESGNIQFKMS